MPSEPRLSSSATSVCAVFVHAVASMTPDPTCVWMPTMVAPAALAATATASTSSMGWPNFCDAPAVTTFLLWPSPRPGSTRSAMSLPANTWGACSRMSSPSMVTSAPSSNAALYSCKPQKLGVNSRGASGTVDRA